MSAIGRRDRIPASALASLEQLEHDTRDGETLHLRLAIDYSSRWIIARAAAELARRVERGTLAPDEISTEALGVHISEGVPQLDLLIRTAGEHGSLTSCCGRQPTQSSTLPAPYGLTSDATISRLPCRSTAIESASSEHCPDRSQSPKSCDV